MFAFNAFDNLDEVWFVIMMNAIIPIASGLIGLIFINTTIVKPVFKPDDFI